MMGMRAWGLAVVIALAVGGLTRGASAAILLGNGKAAADCYAGLDISTDDATVTDERKATVYSCVDGSACDLDGACNGSCTFAFNLCINIPDIDGCAAPAGLEKLRAKGAVTGVKGASGKIKIEVPQFLSGSVCGSFLTMVDVPLKSTGKGNKANTAKLKVDAKAPKGTKPRKDKDKFDLVCEPKPGGCGSAGGAFVD